MSKSLYSKESWLRHLPEKGSDESWRPEWRRDYGRVIHSPSFRRLQGKTQLYPGHESDFFRSRLTHSLEVSQIAESIAYRINGTHDFFTKSPIEPRVCVTAGLLHDIGHPPYGHNGEEALDDKMKRHGGFEGNAQTVRIVTKVDKKRKTEDVPDGRRGLNLCYHTLASVLKYDNKIPADRDTNSKLVKGYYADDAGIVEAVKNAVAPGWKSRKRPFKTIECSIMDIADDIAYSAYDLEDSFKAGFLSPVEILTSPTQLLDRVAKKVAKQIGDDTFSHSDVLDVFLEMFAGLGVHANVLTADGEIDENAIFSSLKTFERSREMASDGYLRTEFFCDLVGKFVGGIEVDFDEEFPSLSSVRLSSPTKVQVETLKNYTYEAMIYSTRIRVAEFRGYEVVSNIFDALSDDRGYLLMPEDVRKLHASNEGNASAQNRVICDFVAGMTDRYAMEFHARLHSDTPQSIFKPV